jgi:hypothetical protein
MTTRMGMLAAIAVLVTGMAQFDVPASAGQAAAAQNGRKFKATRQVVVDAATGQARLPNTEEVAQMVAQLDTLTQRSETLSATTASSGVMRLDLEGGFAGVLLARPDGRGGFETLCVFTFDEGADFLGLVADPQ